MDLDTLIAKLQAHRAFQGNLPVYVDSPMGEHNITRVTEVEMIVNPAEDLKEPEDGDPHPDTPIIYLWGH